MKLTINNELVEISEENPTVAELLEIRNIKPSGSAVMVNGVIVKRGNHDHTRVEEGDEVVIINAAFGG